MPIVMVSLKEGKSPDELDKAKKEVINQGGKITHESKLTPSFHAEFPANKVHTLASNEHLDVEADQEVKTQ